MLGKASYHLDHLAANRLQDYLNGNRQRASATGADADEVAADLRHQIKEQVASLKLPVVTEQDVQRIIAPTGAPLETERAQLSTGRNPDERIRVERATSFRRQSKSCYGLCGELRPFRFLLTAACLPPIRSAPTTHTHDRTSATPVILFPP